MFIKLKPSHLYNKHFIHWANSPVLYFWWVIIKWREVIYNCGLICIYLMISNVKHFAKYLLSRYPKFQPNLPLKHVGSGGLHLLFGWHHTILLPFIVKPDLHLNITVSFKKKERLNPDSTSPFSICGTGHLTTGIHWGGGLFQMPTWLSLLVQWIDSLPTRSNSFSPFFPTWQWYFTTIP